MNEEIFIFLLLFIPFALVIGSMIVRKARKQRRRKPAVNAAKRLRDAPPPPSLVRPNSPANELANKLKDSFPASYKDALRQRMLTEHPGISEREYEWRLLELQRFFILCAVLDRVPMFSKAVDELWHEMLMYTQEYQRFSERFLGRMVHHTPNPTESVPIPGERAWFDLVYVELFGWTPQSALLWGPFFRSPLPRQELAPYQHRSDSLPNDGRFNAWTYEHSREARMTIDAVRNGLKQRIDTADKRPLNQHKVNFNHPEILLASAVFFSWNDPDAFTRHMSPDEAMIKKDGSAAYTGTACSSGSNDRRDHDHDHSSGDDGSSCSSSSSCSSCGGGCSS